MEEEIWLPIAEFDGYEVSNLGRVRNWNSQNGVGGRGLSPRLLKLTKFVNKPYLRVRPSKNGKSKTRRVHHLVLEAFEGPCPEGMEACHDDGDGANNRRDNLRWDTHVENMKDQIRHGTTARGERSSLSKITELQAKAVKAALAAVTGHGSIKRVSEMTGISYRIVADIKCNKTWRHV